MKLKYLLASLNYKNQKEVLHLTKHRSLIFHLFYYIHIYKSLIKTALLLLNGFPNIFN